MSPGLIIGILRYPVTLPKHVYSDRTNEHVSLFSLRPCSDLVPTEHSVLLVPEH